MTPKPATDRKPAQLEHHILEAAREILAEGGIDALSMRTVADRVGVSATALYHYFDSKQALVDRVVESAFGHFGEYLEGTLSRHPEGSIERVAALGARYIEFALEHKEHFSVIFSIQTSNPRAIEELPGGGGYPLLRQCVNEAMASGAMRKSDPDLVSMYLWSVVHGLTTLRLACGSDEPHEHAPGFFHASPIDLLHAFQDFITNGLRPHDGAPSEAGDSSIEELAVNDEAI